MARVQPGRPAALATRLARRGPELLLLAAFVLTRLVARIAFGLRFDGDTLGSWQVLDVAILRSDLLRGVLYQHGQPPLYNLALGLVLKCAPDPLAPAVFEAAFLVLSYLGILGIHALLVELGTPRRAALAAALVQTLSTTWLAYESWLFYTLPVAVLVTWAAVLLARAARGSGAAAVGFAAAVVALSWTRATYHVVWVAASLVLLLIAVRGCAPAVRVAGRRSALVALALAFALPAKNYLLVGTFASSSWLGMNLAHMTTEWLDAATREEWVKDGKLSPVARVRAFSPLSDYPEELRAPPPGIPAHPALVAPTKGDGSPNLNHAAYVRIAREYERAALVVIRERPDVYLGRVRRAIRTWLRPPTDYIYVVPRRELLHSWDRLHSLLLLWSASQGRRDGPSFVLLPAAALFLIALVLRPPSARRELLRLVAFPVLTIAWNAVVGNLLDVGENNRFRVEVEGLMYVLGSFGLVEVARRLRSASAARRLPGGGDAA